MTDDYTQAEMVRSLKRIEQSVTELRADVKQQSAAFVVQSTFDAWKVGIDREIAGLKASRAPWWTVVALGLSALAIVLPLIGG